MKYNEVILQMMMYYPSMYPSEAYCQNYLFTSIGGSYEWTEDGEMTDVDADMRQPREIERTRESILALNSSIKDRDSIEKYFADDESVCFHSCGRDDNELFVLDASPSTGMGQVFSGLVKPQGRWRDEFYSYLTKSFRDSEEKYNKRVAAYFYFRYGYKFGEGNSYIDGEIRRYTHYYAKARPKAKKYLLEEFKCNIDPTQEEKDEQERIASEIIDEVASAVESD